jgi:hypothetical protein
MKGWRVSSGPHYRWAFGAAAAVTAVAVSGCALGGAPRPAAERPTSTPSPSPTAPVSHRLQITEEVQSTRYNAAPAAAVVSLSTFHLKVRQSALAREMKPIDPWGADYQNTVNVLRDHLRGTPYSLTFEGGPSADPAYILKEVAHDVGVLERAPLVEVYRDRLPWHKGGPRGRFPHVIVAYGYDLAKGTITVFDPWPKTGGRRTLPATELTRALQDAGLIYIYS